MDANEIAIGIIDLEDPNLEPQPRARSNTWPLRPNREVEPQSSPGPAEETTCGGELEAHNAKDPLGLTAKKSGSRRNAWGNLSYADLITKAISSSPEKRLTLSQIYDWMVQNVPYFKDKGDSTSSAGWKNSIRHNLSLHNRFMRIQNEGTGKSSWWVLNPDAKPGKTPSRRRVNSMDHKNFEKRRGRVKKKMEALQAAMENGGTLSPGGPDDILDSLNFGDFRPRASSNASSCGRLSPIHAGKETDLHDNQVPPMSPIPWGSELNNSPSALFAADNYTDLVDCLGDGMKLSQEKLDLIRDPYMSTGDFNSQSNNFMEVEGQSQEGQFGQLPAPPPYPKQQTQITGLEFKDFKDFNGLQNFNIVPQFNQSSPDQNPSNSFTQADISDYSQDYSDNFLKQDPERISPMLMNQVNALTVNIQSQQLSSSDPQVSPNNSGLFLSPGNQVKAELFSPVKQESIPQLFSSVKQESLPQMFNPGSQTTQESLPQMSTQKLQQQQHQLRLVSPRQSTARQPQKSTATPQQVSLQQASILREALTRGPPAYRPVSQTPGYTPIPGSLLLQSNSPLAPMTLNINNGLNGLSSSLSPHHQLSSISENVDAESFNDSGRNVNSSIPQDIDLDLIEAFDCDMDQVNVNQVINRELDLEGKLDFNFESVGQNVVH